MRGKLVLPCEENAVRVRMEQRDLTMAIMFLSLLVIGILGNFSLLSHYLEISKCKFTQRDRDLILTHLTIANILTILFKGVPQTVAAFGFKQFLNDLICNLFLYVARVGRSVSIGTTCLLSVFQAITISSTDLGWKKFEAKNPKYVGYSISLCWMSYMVVNFVFPLNEYILMNNKNMSRKRDLEFCTTEGRNAVTDSLYAALLVFPEVLLSGLIIWSSSSMIFILYRHKQQVQHIRSSHVSCRASPETKATHRVLALVSTFLAFHTISSIIRGFNAVLYNPGWWLMNFNRLISLCFPSFGPFALMSQDSSLSRLCFIWIRKKINILLGLGRWLSD